jgi:hypothetical protein
VVFKFGLFPRSLAGIERHPHSGTPQAPRRAALTVLDYYWGVELAALGHLAAAATLGARGIGWRFADQFGGHEAGHEKFAAMVVEFNERALRIRFRDHAESILVMLDLLPLGKCLHDLPPYFQAGVRVQPGHQPLAALKDTTAM